jgi:hypothetical protein
MNFELGKEYIVEVTDKGIIPIEEFDSEKYYNKDTDDLDFLTDEEKALIIESTCNDLIEKIDKDLQFFRDDLTCKTAAEVKNQITEIIKGYYNKNDKEN